MQNLVEKLNSRVNVILKGGGEKAVARHTSRGTKKIRVLDVTKIV